MSIDLSETIVAKSDQLNADDLITGPITVTITSVTKGSTAEQPISIGISGGRQPYKPCKTMRRILVAAWGADGAAYVGRSMTLFRDASVSWGGEKVGGIRISAMSNIKDKLEISLAESRKKKAKFVIQPLQLTGQQQTDAFTAMKSRWKSATTTPTADGFSEFIVSATGGAIAAADVLKPTKYTQAILDQCEAAIIAMGQVDKSDLSQQNDPAHAHRQTMLTMKDENDRANLLEAIHESFSDGHLTEDTASELSREVKDFKIRGA